MFPFLQIGPIALPMYGATIALGLLLALWFCITRVRAKGLSEDDLTSIVVYALVFGFLGSKLLYILTALQTVSLSYLFSPEHLLETLLAGFVFYGGLIGGILGLVFCWRVRKIPLPNYLNLIVPALPLAHGIGRIGCFFAGCCYGIPMDPPFGIAFTHSIGAPNGIPLFPVQLLEAGINLLLFVFLWLYTKKERPNWSAVAIYIGLYSIERFFLEYLRYDSARGIYGPFSISQWISIALLPLCLIWLALIHVSAKRHKVA